MPTKQSIPQNAATQAVEFVLEDGIHYDPSIQEYVVALDGEIINYATHQSTAWFQYSEALRLRREHIQRQPKNLLDLALDEVEARNQWHNGQSVTIWQEQPFEAWLKNESGFLTLTLFREGQKLTDRKYSKSLAIGCYDPQHRMWVQMPTVEADYESWKAEAKKAVA